MSAEGKTKEGPITFGSSEVKAMRNLLEAAEQALEFYKTELEELGVCDHAVNICYCGIVSEKHDLAKAVEVARVLLRR